MKYRIILAFLLINSLCFAQQANSTILNKLVNQAIDYSARIKEQNQNILLGETKTSLLIAQQKPIVSSEVGISRIDPAAKAQFAGPIPSTLQFQPNMNYNANVGASYVLFDWGKQLASIEKSKLETNLYKISTEAIKSAIAYQVASLYYSVIFTKKAMEVQNEQINLINQNSILVDNKLKQGDAIEYDKIALEVRLSNANTRLVELQSQMSRQLIYLSNLVGYDVTSDMQNVEGFDLNTIVNIDNAMENAQKNNTDLKLINQRNEILSFEQKMIDLSMKPSLTASAQAGIRNGYLPRINGELPPLNEDFRFNSVLGIKLVVPIYNGHKKDIMTQQVNIMMNTLKHSAEIVNQTLERDLQLAQNDLQLAQSKLVSAQKNIEQADYALKLATSRFKNGLLTSIEIEKAQTDLKDSQFVKLQYQYQITTAQLEINRISGLIFWK